MSRFIGDCGFWQVSTRPRCFFLGEGRRILEVPKIVAALDCHYGFSKRTLPTCEEAAACIAKKVHKDRENKKVNVFVATDAISEVVRGGEKTDANSSSVSVKEL